MRSYKNGKLVRTDHRAANPNSVTRRDRVRDPVGGKTIEQEHDQQGRFARSIKANYIDSDGDGLKDMYLRANRSPATAKPDFRDLGTPPAPVIPVDPPIEGPDSLTTELGAPAAGPGSLDASLQPPVAGPGSLVAESPWNGNQNSVSFDGTNSYMKCDDNFVSLFRSSFSVSFWVRFNDTTGTQVVLSSSNATSYDRIQSWHDGTNLNVFYEADDVNSGRLISGSQTWTNWNHIVATFKQSGSSCASVLYVNGSSVASKSETLDMSAYGTVGTPPDFLAWGARAQATAVGLHSNVKLDEMAFFGSALSAYDVSSIYNGGVPADLSSFLPAHWWRMGDNNGASGTTVSDQRQGAGGVDGELINSPTLSTDVPT